MTVVRFKPNVGRSVYRGARITSAHRDFAAAVKADMDEIVHNYKDWTQHIEEQSANVLEDALRPTFEMSQELVPYLSGELHDSGYLETRQVRGHSRVEIGYGRGGIPDYAIFVHEDLHARHRPPTQAKFLQMPLEADEANIMARVQEGLQIAGGFLD